MRVLVACEFSGIVREAFRKRGHDAWSCDLLPTEIPGAHIQADAVLVAYSGNWDLMIAHPPCTYLSNAGVVFLKRGENKDRMKKVFEAREFFMKFINCPIKHIAVENPVPHRYAELPSPDQMIQPFYFGDAFQKKTYLWLKNVPPLFSTLIDINPESTTTARWYNVGGKNRRSNRSRTFPGIAEAMADQWGNIN